MILAAGKGSRMQPLTLNTPKPLVEVAGKPLIQYHLEKLETAGFKDVIINISWLAEKLRFYLENEYKGSLNVIISYEEEALETGGGILFALEHLTENDEPFLVINSDVMTDFDYRLVKRKVSGLAHLYMVDNPEHNVKGDYVINPEGLLKVKNAKDDSAAVTFSGISVLSPRLFAKCCVQKFSLAALFIEYAECSKVTAEMLNASWFDVGTLDRLTAASKWQNIQ